MSLIVVSEITIFLYLSSFCYVWNFTIAFVEAKYQVYWSRSLYWQHVYISFSAELSWPENLFISVLINDIKLLNRFTWNKYMYTSSHWRIFHRRPFMHATLWTAKAKISFCFVQYLSSVLLTLLILFYTNQEVMSLSDLIPSLFQ